MVTKKSSSRKRTSKKKPAAIDSQRSKTKESNRKKLENAGIVDSDYHFSPEDSEAIEGLSNQEVIALISVYTQLGPDFFEDNCPNGFVF